MKFVDAFQQFGHILFYYNVETTMWHLSFSNDKANEAIAFSSLHEILDRALRTSSPFPEDVEQAKIFTSDYENLSSKKRKIVKENRDKFLRPKRLWFSHTIAF
jgi:hypothetical protein